MVIILLDLNLSNENNKNDKKFQYLKIWYFLILKNVEI